MHFSKEDTTCLDSIKSGEYIKLVIEDTGIGITKAIRGKIFEPFFTSKGVGKGTGLGLSVVLGIVQTHKAAINVYSEVGKGTAFTLYFPLINKDTDNKETKVIDLIKGKGENIFVIEDEMSIQRMLNSVFERSNYKGFFAGTLAQAEKIYKQYADEIDLVLCDIVLPDGDGTELIKKLNKIKPIRKLIFTSGYIDVQSRWKEIQEEKIPFIHKPFNILELLKLLSETLKS
ncbi:MAG: response regulator [Elusimicrobia bacterium]|nr:response regulator [Elusimicrobiota bacterium]